MCSSPTLVSLCGSKVKQVLYVGLSASNVRNVLSRFAVSLASAPPPDQVPSLNISLSSL